MCTHFVSFLSFGNGSMSGLVSLTSACRSTLVTRAMRRIPRPCQWHSVRNRTSNGRCIVGSRLRFLFFSSLSHFLLYGGAEMSSLNTRSFEGSGFLTFCCCYCCCNEKYKRSRNKRALRFCGKNVFWRTTSSRLTVDEESRSPPSLTALPLDLYAEFLLGNLLRWPVLDGFPFVYY